MGNSFPELTKKRITAGMNTNDIAAFVIFACFSVFLYAPNLRVNVAQVFCGFNTMAAAWGAYFLSKRWINNWTPLLMAGAVYGFGPFALSFETFHPLAGLSFAMVPWLLLPAVYWHKGKTPDANRFCIRALLTLLPFAGMILLFWIPSQQWAGPFFLMPKELSMTVGDLQNVILPLRNSGGVVVVGLYHCSLIFALMGVFVYIKLQRIALLIPIAAGLILSFWEPVFQVTPIVWGAFPILFLSVLCGLGLSGVPLGGQSGYKMDCDLCRRRNGSGGLFQRRRHTQFDRKNFRINRHTIHPRGRGPVDTAGPGKIKPPLAMVQMGYPDFGHNHRPDLLRPLPF